MMIIITALQSYDYASGKQNKVRLNFNLTDERYGILRVYPIEKHVGCFAEYLILVSSNVGRRQYKCFC